MGYRGTLDRIVRMDAGLFVIDLKGGQAAPWHPYQTALYALAYQAEIGGPTQLRACVYLHAEGKRPRFVLHRDRHDFDRAKAIITVAHMKLGMRVPA